MRIFSMEQDRSLTDLIQFRDFDIRGPRHIFYKEDAAQIRGSVMLFLARGSGETAPDLIQYPVQMVSDPVKKVLDMYEDDMVWRTVAITDKERENVMIYHHLLPERLDVFSERTEFYPNGSIKKLVMDARKIGGHKVFMADDRRSGNPYVSLEVVESLLRRGVVGIIWKEVEVEDGGVK